MNDSQATLVLFVCSLKLMEIYLNNEVYYNIINVIQSNVIQCYTMKSMNNCNKT